MCLAEEDVAPWRQGPLLPQLISFVIYLSFILHQQIVSAYIYGHSMMFWYTHALCNGSIKRINIGVTTRSCHFWQREHFKIYSFSSFEMSMIYRQTLLYSRSLKHLSKWGSVASYWHLLYLSAISLSYKQMRTALRNGHLQRISKREQRKSNVPQLPRAFVVYNSLFRVVHF